MESTPVRQEQEEDRWFSRKVQISNTQTDRLVVSLRGLEQVVQLSLPAEKKVKVYTAKGQEPGGRQESDCGGVWQVKVIQNVCV